MVIQDGDFRLKLKGIYCISFHFCGTWSFLNLVGLSLEVELNREMNRVISQFGGTGSFLISVEQGHFSILWNRVISQFDGVELRS